ncbi:LysR family transcriptional regulator, glycine cleavage system transcriptional activator [Pseudomonas cuatrocienegasensis]|uniref:LysR family transcriptional regulator, glycine cleavage system transcriptional activator n=1 Tax=Pseudomonas cuatrocienegasensis TaxID=543360 RepID=A0ABY1BEN0_9PSED|nr:MULTISPECIES: LysR substrate-binding domain-containing protein [Pseudomonas]OEC34026.1 hypothetical protein A7D25_15785 [Pseudomonas sp. 21C1]SEQ67299.1 LysR family transcriptional regulator, glycine cleavage system transcriptional activator [Pseudomonas cuatrocienegasensis]
MSIRLPPLESLRYFEAAARHLSFTLAADELCISQSAVSQQVIQLEQRLGCKLFERRPRHLLLTTPGIQLYPAVRAALGLLSETLGAIETLGQRSKLTVYCMPSFANRWLMPRLQDFHNKHPHIDLHLIAEFSEPNFHNEIVDIGICHGFTDQQATEQRLLFRDYVYPVVSPSLQHKLQLKEPADLSRAVLLHDSLPQAKLATSWQKWLGERGIRHLDCSGGYRFNQADLIVGAALNDRGVALGRHVLVADEVASGHLLALFDDVVEEDGVYMVFLKKSAQRPPLQAFCAWLEEQAQIFERDDGSAPMAYPAPAPKLQA